MLTANPKSTSTTPVNLGSDQSIYFYLNANLLSAGYNNKNNVFAGFDYKDYVTIGDTSVITENNNCVRLSVNVKASGNANAITDVVRYKINFAPGGMDSVGIGFSEDENMGLSTDKCEASLNAEMSEECDKDDIQVKTSIRSRYFTKCIYALGDVNRDGVVDSSDSSIMESFMVNLGASNPSRSEKEQQCDVVAFGLAADCNQDNVVNILDAIYLNHHLADPGYYPL